MLITFKCRQFHDIVTVGDVGNALLKAMGQNGSVPGIIRSEETGKALSNLKSAIAGPIGDTPTPTESEGYEDEEVYDDEAEEASVPLSHRAIPLIKMLETAVKEECDVQWE